MKKKIVNTVMIGILIFSLAGCKSTQPDNQQTTITTGLGTTLPVASSNAKQNDMLAEGVSTSRFDVVSSDSIGNGNIFTVILVDKRTKVLYVYAAWGRGGGLTVMLDKDGKPALYSK